MTRRPAPTRDQTLTAVETALAAALIEVEVTQDGGPLGDDGLTRLVRVLDNAGLIDWSGVPR